MNGENGFFVGNKIILFEKGLMVEKSTVGSFQLENKYISDVFVKHDYMNDY